jgi:hypothetical protein
MEYMIAVILCAVGIGYLVFRHKNKKAMQDTYVCDICGQKECLCHKVEKK